MTTTDLSRDSEKATASPKRTMPIAEFCARYDLGQTKAYDEINAGRLQACKLGRSTVIREEDAERWLASLPPFKPFLTPANRYEVMTRLVREGKSAKLNRRLDVREVLASYFHDRTLDPKLSALMGLPNVETRATIAKTLEGRLGLRPQPGDCFA